MKTQNKVTVLYFMMPIWKMTFNSKMFTFEALFSFFWTMNVLGFTILSRLGLLQLVMDLFLSHIAHNAINNHGHMQLWPPASLPVTFCGLPCLWGVLDTDHWTTIKLPFFPLKERLAVFVFLLFFCWSYFNFFVEMHMYESKTVGSAGWR